MGPNMCECPINHDFGVLFDMRILGFLFDIRILGYWDRDYKILQVQAPKSPEESRSNKSPLPAHGS